MTHPWPPTNAPTSKSKNCSQSQKNETRRKEETQTKSLATVKADLAFPLDDSVSSPNANTHIIVKGARANVSYHNFYFLLLFFTFQSTHLNILLRVSDPPTQARLSSSHLLLLC